LIRFFYSTLLSALLFSSSSALHRLFIGSSSAFYSARYKIFISSLSAFFSLFSLAILKPEFSSNIDIKLFWIEHRVTEPQRSHWFRGHI